MGCLTCRCPGTLILTRPTALRGALGPEPGASSCRGAARPVRWGKRFTGRAVHHRPAGQRAFVVCGRAVSPDERHAEQLPEVRTLRRDVLLVGHHCPTLRLSYAS